MKKYQFDKSISEFWLAVGRVPYKRSATVISSTAFSRNNNYTSWNALTAMRRVNIWTGEILEIDCDESQL